jgi:hypothetical protein
MLPRVNVHNSPAVTVDLPTKSMHFSCSIIRICTSMFDDHQLARRIRTYVNLFWCLYFEFHAGLNNGSQLGKRIFLIFLFLTFYCLNRPFSVIVFPFEPGFQKSRLADQYRVLFFNLQQIIVCICILIVFNFIFNIYKVRFFKFILNKLIGI